MNAPVTLPVPAATVFAWEAAYALIEDANVTDALDAIEDRETDFFNGCTYIDAYGHLGDVADQALSASEKCAKAGLTELCTRLRAIDARLRAVCTRGRGDVRQARIDLIHLTAAAKAALSSVPGM